MLDIFKIYIEKFKEYLLSKASLIIDQVILIYKKIPEHRHKDLYLVTALVIVLSFLIYFFFRFIVRLFKIDYQKKAENLLKRGKYEKALRLFLKLKLYTKAAFCCLKLTRIKEAAEYFLKAKEFEMAAKYFGLEKEYKKAAEIYEKVGKKIEAAEMHFKANDVLTAAELYKELNLLKKAEEMYVKLDKFREIALMYKEQFLKEKKATSKSSSTRRLEKVRVLALKAGQYFNRIGDYEEASEIFLKSNLIKEAVVAYEKLGEYLKSADLCLQLEDNDRAARFYVKAQKWDKAIELYEEMGKKDEVADVMEQAGRKSEASEIRANLSLERQDIEKGAKHLEEAGKYVEAAKLFEEAKKIKKAAELYEKGQNIEKAAELYQSLKDFDKAAELYKSISRYKSAAYCYKEKNNERAYLEMLLLGESYLDAALHYQDKNEQDAAIEVLQKIEENSPDYKTACNMLGKIFAGRNIQGLAREKLSAAVEGKEMGKRNLDLFYDLAVFKENNGEESEALGIYEKILAFDFYFRDVQDRRSILEAKVPKAEPKKDISSVPVNQLRSSSAKFTSQVINNRYDMLEEIGRGGMGVVFKATDRSLDRLVALKFLPNDFIRDTSDIEKFINEAKSAAKLNHMNIVTIHNIDQVEGDYFIVMEYVDGANLKEIIDMAHNLPYKTIHLIAGQICEALHYAHKMNVVHRDIKNANIMWTNEKIVKITDFGLAKILEDGLKTSTRVQGSPVYMSPEQVLGKDIDSRTDIYSLGVSLYEMTTGKVPFERGDIGYHHLNTIPEPPEAIRSDMPKYLSSIIKKCLSKRPDDRYSDAQEILDILKQNHS